MKKQLILIGILVVALAIAGTVFGLNRGAGETAQGAIVDNTVPAYQGTLVVEGFEPEWYIGEDGFWHVSPVPSAGETAQGATSTNSNLTPKYYDEVQSTDVSPEGWPHELFILQLNSQVPQTPNNVVYYDVPEYDGQPLPEGFSSDTNNQASYAELIEFR